MFEKRIKPLSCATVTRVNVKLKVKHVTYGGGYSTGTVINKCMLLFLLVPI